MKIGLLFHMECSVVVLVIISPLVDVSLQKLNETPAANKNNLLLLNSVCRYILSILKYCTFKKNNNSNKQLSLF